MTDEKFPEEMTDSYPRRLAGLFEQELTRKGVDLTLFHFSGDSRDELLKEGIGELRRLARLRCLWSEAK